MSSSLNAVLTLQTRQVCSLPQFPGARPAQRLRCTRSSLFGRELRSAPSRSKVLVSHDAPIVAAAPTGAGTVRIIIQGRRLEVTDAIKSYVEKKLSKALDHYAPSIKTAEVTLSVRGGDTGTKGTKAQKTEVTIRTLRNGVVRSEETAESLYASVDLVSDKVGRKLQKVKEIAMDKGKWPGRGGRKGAEKLRDVESPITESLDFEEAEFKWEPEIVRTKYFTLETMNALDAAETLEKLGHSFYVFRDDVTQSIQVLYKRKERGYGLIVPVTEPPSESNP